MPAPARPPAVAAARPLPRWHTPLLCALLVFATLIVYQPALHGDLLWDDAGHVTAPALQPLAGLHRIWFEVGATQQYYPLLHTAFWIEHRLWGDAVLGYHLLNVLLHATSACLFAGLLMRLGRHRLRAPGIAANDTAAAQINAAAWLAAFLFAVHPVCIESVAWISEQKNTLSTVFYLASALAYLEFDARRRPAATPTTAGRSQPTGSHRFYVLATLLFVLALLTKTVTATLPAALLVVIWWQRTRLAWHRDVLPLVPWLAVGVAVGLFTARFEHDVIGASGADFGLNALQRGLLAGRVFWFYLGKLVWPANLIFIYPHWQIDATNAVQWAFPLAAVALFVALLAVAARGPARLQPAARAGLAAALLFAGTLFPVLGFFNVFPFLYSYVADHFQYLASLPVFALAAAGLMGNAPTVARIGRRLRVGIGVAVLVVLAALSRGQAGMYRNASTLYETTLARNPACWMAHNNLAIILASSGHVSEAVPHLEAALRLKPDYAPAENNLGDDLMQLGRVAEAIPHFERALRLQPNYAFAHRNLGMALAMTNHVDDAVAHFARAVAIDPAYAEAELDWAVGLTQTGNAPAALSHFERAVLLAPRSVDAQIAYADALAGQRDFESAVAHYRAALALDPSSTEAHRGLAAVLRRLGRSDEAHERELAARPAGGKR